VSLAVELTEKGYLHLEAELAARYFPQDALAALVRGAELWLTPLRGGGGGGLILKQRNRAGDRSVLVWEALPPATPPGRRAAFWDAERATLRVALLLPALPEVAP
jgi:hypothetical protein